VGYEDLCCILLVIKSASLECCWGVTSAKGTRIGSQKFQSNIQSTFLGNSYRWCRPKPNGKFPTSDCNFKLSISKFVRVHNKCGTDTRIMTRWSTDGRLKPV